MAGITKTTSPAGTWTNHYRNYFDKQLLAKIMPNLQLAKYAKRAPLPKGAGGTTIQWHAYTAPATTDIQTLTEGTPPALSTSRQLNLEYVSKALVQYGQTITITDIMSHVDIFNSTEAAIQANGEDFALQLDTIIRNELASDMSAHTRSDKTYTYAGTAAAFATVYNTGSYSASYLITYADILDAVTALKANSAPTIDGYYVAVAAPQITRDIMKDTTAWLPAHSYSDTLELYKGEVGRLAGARFVETTNAWRSNTQYTYNASGVVFSTFIFGRDSYGVPDISSRSPYSPGVQILDKADKSDPHNQQKVIAMSAWFAAKALNPKWINELYTQTGYGNN